MKRLISSLLLIALFGLASCAKTQQDRKFQDYAAHYLQAQKCYTSSDVTVAEKGLLEFKSWLLTTPQADEVWGNSDMNLTQVNARLFVLYEYQGDTNRANEFYIASMRSYLKLCEKQHIVKNPLSKEELREWLTKQEKYLDVKWKTSNAK